MMEGPGHAASVGPREERGVRDDVEGHGRRPENLNAVAVGGDDASVQLDLHAGGHTKLLKDELHLLGVVGHAIDSVTCDGIALAEATHQFLIEAGFIEIEQIT